VKLLFDENVSPKLVGLLEIEFPQSAHVYNVGLRVRPTDVSGRMHRAFLVSPKRRSPILIISNVRRAVQRLELQRHAKPAGMQALI
jgi:hypothetical protein